MENGMIFNELNHVEVYNLIFTFFLIILIISIVTISVLIYFVYFYYLIPKRYKDDEVIRIPQDFYRDNELLKNDIKDNNNKINEMFKKIYSLTQDVQQNIDSTKPRLDILTDQIQLKDSEIEKYKEGLEIINIKKSINQFLNTYDVLFSILNAIEESGKLNENYKNYQAINEQLKSALDINGIEIFIPQLNQDYTKSKGVSSENVIKSETDDPKLVNKIIQVVKPGYILISNGKILRNAQVKIYVTNNKGVLNG